jgi:hypothetical protein
LRTTEQNKKDQNGEKAGTDITIFQKKIAKKLAFFVQNSVTFAKFGL